MVNHEVEKIVLVSKLYIMIDENIITDIIAWLKNRSDSYDLLYLRITLA